MARTQIVIFRLVLLAAVAAITYLATTRQEIPVAKDISDKINHVLAFYVLALLVDYSFPPKGLRLAKILALMVFGALIELTQSLLPDRTASLLDLFADGFGIAIYKLSLSLLKHVPLLGRR